MQTASDVCAICSAAPQDLLILGCLHHLCLSCATDVFQASPAQDTITCEICGQSTQLDNNTVTCLIDLQAELAQQPGQSAPRSSALRSPTHMPLHMKSNVRLCTQHDQQPIYYCFDCDTDEICSQCILQQLHLNHEVMTRKKATQKMENLLIAKARSREMELQTTYQSLLQAKQAQEAFNKESRREREKLQTVFQRLHQIIDKKYEAMMAELESEAKHKNELFEGCCQLLEQHVTQEKIQIEEAIRMHIESPGNIVETFKRISSSKKPTPPIPSVFPKADLKATELNLIYSAIQKLLDGLEWQKAAEIQPLSMIQSSNCECPMDPQNCFQHALSDSKQNNLERSNNSHTAMKKLEVSRRADNATLIISKMQERSRRV